MLLRLVLGVEINTDNSTSEIDPLDRLKTLDGSTWLNDLVINDYGELLIKACPDVFVFSSYFSTSFYNKKRLFHGEQINNCIDERIGCNIRFHNIFELLLKLKF